MDYEKIIRDILQEITLPNGEANVNAFTSLNAVEHKISEAKMFFRECPNSPDSLLEEMERDEKFTFNSRRVRLESLSLYCKRALKLISQNIPGKNKPKIIKAPDFSSLTGTNVQLKECLDKRWLEAQVCMHNKLYLSAVILMGSILEGLLLAKALNDQGTAYQSKCAPKDKGRGIAVNDWKLSSLIDVAVDVGWICKDRGSFSHALRESRNFVHPWAAAAAKAEFDLSTAEASWAVLKGSVHDLLK